MKSVLSVLMILSALPMQALAFDASIDARCREHLTAELKKAVELNPEFVREAALAKQSGSDLVIKDIALQLVGRTSSTDFSAVAKVYVASSREDDPAQYERLKFTFGLRIGATVTGTCFLPQGTTFQKTLR